MSGHQPPCLSRTPRAPALTVLLRRRCARVTRYWRGTGVLLRWGRAALWPLVLRVVVLVEGEDVEADPVPARHGDLLDLRHQIVPAVREQTPFLDLDGEPLAELSRVLVRGNYSLFQELRCLNKAAITSRNSS